MSDARRRQEPPQQTEAVEYNASQSAPRVAPYRLPPDTLVSAEGRGGSLGEAAQALRILGHPSRMAIAVLLLEGPTAVSTIESRLGLRQPNLSQHLGLLRDARLLTAARHAKSVVYTLADGPQRELVTALAHIYGLAAAAPTPIAAPAIAPGANTRSASQEADDASVFAHIVPGRAV
ncbi:ArsR/SmtB family transcription factor [Chitinasiproducens palmae]|uniref:DNA-binding transcriptional regulator, ArsR family n=1 Tax=Chitinasiproducens palmae TaxID=1770053 RepID=A0A1H2PQ67_9BURK|nr:metalloregulator ArsR/SmtB family transcription factor [Chitinasiproducens palmae]SDV48968.1 DNA-binding transcriptional regulator, ArsR family [Chitinasiproducens palmae]